VILSGWKEIANYLGCGVRTAQRWEAKGLPINRPNPGRRGHVVTETSQIDGWIHDSAFRQRGDFSLLATIQRSRELRRAVERQRQTLHQKLDALKRELAELASKRRAG